MGAGVQRLPRRRPTLATGLIVRRFGRFPTPNSPFPASSGILLPLTLTPGRPVIYAWTKTLHLLFVIAWMASVFYLPRILVNLAEVGDQPAVRERLVLMGRRLYRFGHVMFGLLLVFGVPLWLGYRFKPEWWPAVTSGQGWMHAKLTLVCLLFFYFLGSARLLRGAAAGKGLPSSKALRWFNELPILLALGVIFLVIAKPF
jgi:putative membrane protein